MLFNSLGFIVFLIVVLAFYYSPMQWTNKKRMLLLASYLFYAMWNPPLILLLWISTVVDWTAAKRMFRTSDPKARKRWLILSLCVNLGFLAFFKYGGFLLENFIWLLNTVGLDFQAAAPDIILPMGISFYTFQTMSYTIDVYRGKTEPAGKFLDFALFVTFFPQLVAGPIVRSTQLIPQFAAPKRATQRQFIWGAFLLTLGLFQKVIMADVLLSSAADAVFGAGSLLHPVDAWGGTLAFSGQIFFDFAGYSTCAIGIALMLGIIIPDNFRYPYAAIGFSDLWRRWHITLSSWLRDYLYIPLGGNRRGPVRTYVNLTLTMLLGGLWHGAAWTFVAWGGLHGIYLMIERFLRGKVRLRINAWNGILLAFLTFTCVNITWVFFRAREFDTAIDMLGSMFLLNGGVEKVLQSFDVLVVYVVIAILFVVHWLMRNTSVREATARAPWWLLGLAWAVMLFLLVIAQSSGEQFIYFQF
ncbi:MAG: MBOAT family O-acyltransferase [Saprospiraceae bacterium]|nr:MBOAT family O-acyltransferase [Saprospiraceae bacterium]